VRLRCLITSRSGLLNTKRITTGVITETKNNFMKTAMQELIEYVEKRMAELKQSNTVENVCRMAFFDVIAHIKADELLEKEKQQITDAAWWGHDNKPEMIHPPETFGEDYYNQTFNQ